MKKATFYTINYDNASNTYFIKRVSGYYFPEYDAYVEKYQKYWFATDAKTGMTMSGGDAKLSYLLELLPAFASRRNDRTKTPEYKQHCKTFARMVAEYESQEFDNMLHGGILTGTEGQ